MAVALTVGESVDDATSQNITIQGPSGYEATTTIGVDQISTVKVGQRATVTPDSDHAPLTGTVAADLGLAGVVVDDRELPRDDRTRRAGRRPSQRWHRDGHDRDRAERRGPRRPDLRRDDRSMADIS